MKFSKLTLIELSSWNINQVDGVHDSMAGAGRLELDHDSF
jgi:hypothetical protein